MDIETNQFAMTQEELAAVMTRFLYKRNRLYFAIAIAINLVGAVFLAVQIGFWASAPLVVIAALTVIYYVYYYPFYSRRYAANPANKKFFVPRSARITDDTMVVTTVEGESSTAKWATIVEIRDHGENVLVYLAQYLFLFFPKRAFKTDSDWKIFKEFAAAHPTFKK